MLDVPALVTDEENGAHYVSLDALIRYGERTYDLAINRTLEEARLAASFTEYFRFIKRELEAEENIRDLDEDLTNKPTIGEADPELERLLQEEEDIDRAIALGWPRESAESLIRWAGKGGK